MTQTIHALFLTHSRSAIPVKSVFLLVFTAWAFFARAQSPELAITEIMSDPTPAAGLPGAEYLEILNYGTAPLSLSGFRLRYGSRSGLLPGYRLPPDGYVIVCHTSDTSLLSVYGPVIGLPNFSLPNDGADLSLHTPEGRTVFHISYAPTWWPESRRGGGYALEMADPAARCRGILNWQVSGNPAGGTPGQPNSVRADPAALPGPACVEQVRLSLPGEICLLFSRELDSLSFGEAVFSLPGHRVERASLQQPAFREVRIQTQSPLVPGEKSVLSIRNLRTCDGYVVPDFSEPVGYTPDPAPEGIVISEILFNPLQNGVDFVELHNRGNDFVSLRDWSIGNVRNGVPDVFRTITTEDIVISPGDYLALTVNPELVKLHYPTGSPRKFLRVASLPSFPNTGGGSVVKTADGRMADELIYTEKLHHQLISHPKGVSLELTNPGTPDPSGRQWHSASSLSGYATPGYRNSQLSDIRHTFTVTPEAFTPDGDGTDDVMSLGFSFEKPGNMLSVSVFDYLGRLVRPLARHLLAGTSGTVTWDGKDAKGETVPTGYYLIIVNTFDLTGKKTTFKGKIVVIR